MATGRPLLIEAVASEQATPTSTIDEAGAGRAMGAQDRGELAHLPSPTASACAGATLLPTTASWPAASTTALRSEVTLLVDVPSDTVCPATVSARARPVALPT